MGNLWGAWNGTCNYFPSLLCIVIVPSEHRYVRSLPSGWGTFFPFIRPCTTFVCKFREEEREKRKTKWGQSRPFFHLSLSLTSIFPHGENNFSRTVTAVSHYFWRTLFLKKRRVIIIVIEVGNTGKQEESLPIVWLLSLSKGSLSSVSHMWEN